MLTKYAELLKKEFSQQRAFNHVVEISQHHRIQSSPGHRAAAQYCADTLRKAGLQTETLSYRGDGKTRYWQYLMPEEWAVSKGTLEIIDPLNEVIADFEDTPISLIQRSIATPYEGVEAELIILDKGDSEENYPDLDFTGKLVLTSGKYDLVQEWAVKRGALGIITDRIVELPPVRHRYDMGDALTYTSFWWSGDEPRCFGFVLSPKTGDRLRRLAAKGQTIRLKATIEASFYSGEIEVVNGFIPGTSDQEVVIVAHLCHPQPSANDNASGCGVAIETARTLQSLINKGLLPQPTRGIRFLLLPEMTGTFAFLANNAELIPNMIAALNLDMVGQNQSLCQGPLIAELPPHACGHFAGDLIVEALNAVTAEVSNLAGTASYALFKHTVAPFSGGSDHYILSDPSVGVGCPMLIQWPDKFYHTSLDTIDKVDPEMLKRVGIISGLYAYFCATAGVNEALWLAEVMAFSFKDWVNDYLKQQYAQAILQIKDQDYQKLAVQKYNITKHLNYLLNIKKTQFGSLIKLSPDIAKKIADCNQEISNYVREQLDQADTMFEDLCEINGCQKDILTMQPTEPDQWLIKAKNILPRRLSRGPLSLRGRINQLSPETRAEYKRLTKLHSSDFGKMTYLLYWMDGKRNLAEIIELIEHEIGNINYEIAVFIVNILKELQLIAL